MDLVAMLQDAYLSNGLLEEETRKLAEIADSLELEDGQPLLKAGDPASDFYVLLRGRLIVEGVEGEPIARLGVGAIVGEVAILNPGERTATVTSDGPCTVARFSAENFYALVDKEPRIGIRVLRNVGASVVDRLRRTNLQLERVLAAAGF